MDRMDLKVWVQPVETKHLSNGNRVNHLPVFEIGLKRLENDNGNDIVGCPGDAMRSYKEIQFDSIVMQHKVHRIYLSRFRTPTPFGPSLDQIVEGGPTAADLENHRPLNQTILQKLPPTESPVWKTWHVENPTAVSTTVWHSRPN